MKVSILVPLVFGIFTKVSATPLTYGLSEQPPKFSLHRDDSHSHYSHNSDTDTGVCEGAITIASTWIGAAKNVEVKSIFCPDFYQRRDELEQRQTNPTNVCGAPCEFYHDFSFRYLEIYSYFRCHDLFYAIRRRSRP